MKQRTFLLLHALLLFYSLSDIFSKLAAGTALFSFSFFLCYGAVILILLIYAIGWQQIIKRMPLSTAFANKAVTTIWGTIWGILLFQERFSLGKAIGIILVITGIVLYSGEAAASDD